VLTTWALEHYLGIRDESPEPLVVGDDALAVYAGRYETIAAVCTVTVESGRLVVATTAKPSMAEALGENEDDEAPIPLALVAGERDPFVIPDGPAKGMRGYFSRDADGRIDGMHFGGRLASRVDLVSEPA